MSPIIDARWILFTRVAEINSISRAALELDLPQSVVSRRIAQLEADCGAPLFRRTGRGVALTDFGQLVYSRIKALDAQAQEIADEVRSRGGAPVGIVKLGLLPATVPVLAGALFAEVQDALPHVRLHLLEGSTGQLEQWLAEGKLDFALVLREESTLANREQVLARQQLHLVTRRDGPLGGRTAAPLREVQLLPLVLAARPHAMRDLMDRVSQESGLAFQVVAEADSIRLQHELIASGRAHGLMLGPLAAGEHAGLVALPVSDPTLQRAVVLVHAAQRPATLATREVARRLALLARSAMAG